MQSHRKRNRNHETFDAVLGIDLGSTSTRAFIWCPARGIQFDVDNRKIPQHLLDRLERGDFPSEGYPFDEGQMVYLGEAPDYGRRAISLKYAFYILTLERDRVFDGEYSLVTPLREHRDDQDFQSRLQEGLVDLLSAVHEEVVNQCDLHSLKIKTIALSIPTQWTLEFEDVYKQIVLEVFPLPEDSICFYTETESLAHVLMTENLKQILTGGDHDVFLFLDFGGHNMNGCIFNIVYNEDRKGSFYRIHGAFGELSALIYLFCDWASDNVQGKGGGSELWSYYVCQHFANVFRQRTGRLPNPSESEDMLRSFNRNKDRLGPHRSNGPLSPDGHRDIKLLEEDINDCFERGLREVLEEARRQIEVVSRMQGPDLKPVVIVSGGTARHSCVKARLKDMCNASGIERIIFVDEICNIRYSSGKIARGVAYAASNRITLEEFFQRGAAIGLQRKRLPTRGQTNSEQEWDNFTEHGCFFSLKDTRPWLFQATGNDEYRIICHPFFEARQGVTERTLNFDKCYNFLHLGELRNGRWQITFALTTVEGQTMLTFETRRRGYHGDTEETTSTTLPMFFDGGTNCYFVNEKDFQVASLGLGPKPTRKKRSRVCKATQADGITRRITRSLAVKAIQGTGASEALEDTLASKGEEDLMPFPGKPPPLDDGSNSAQDQFPPLDYGSNSSDELFTTPFQDSSIPFQEDAVFFQDELATFRAAPFALMEPYGAPEAVMGPSIPPKPPSRDTISHSGSRPQGRCVGDGWEISQTRKFSETNGLSAYDKVRSASRCSVVPSKKIKASELLIRRRRGVSDIDSDSEG